MARRKDLTGQRFGNREVLEFAGRNTNGRSLWRVEYNCGNIFECTNQDLYRKGPCIQCGHKGERPYRRLRPFEAVFNTFVGRARHPVNLTYDEFFALTKTSDCHYCGDAIYWQEWRKQSERQEASHLDRKDSALPYELDNVVVCCTRCNKAKNNHFTYDEWKQLGNLIRSWRGAK